MTGLFSKKEKVAAQVIMLGVGELMPNSSQPRRQFSEEQLLSLSQSIKENGIIQPICVRKRARSTR